METLFRSEQGAFYDYSCTQACSETVSGNETTSSPTAHALRDVRDQESAKCQVLHECKRSFSQAEHRFKTEQTIYFRSQASRWWQEVHASWSGVKMLQLPLRNEETSACWCLRKDRHCRAQSEGYCTSTETSCFLLKISCWKLRSKLALGQKE